jgi:hypothetical protein
MVLKTSNECSPYFVAPAMLLATRTVDGLGHPAAGPQSSEFRWPSASDIREACPAATRIFEAAFATHAPSSASLRRLGEVAWSRKCTLECEIAGLQQQIDRSVYDLFEIETVERQRIEEEVSFRQCQPDLGDEETEGEQSPETAESGVGDIPRSETTVSDSNAFVRDEVMRLLSYAVRVVVENDDDGIVPILQVGDELTLAQRVKSQIGEWFGTDQIDAKWAEAAEILGKPVEEWLAIDYFEYHVDMYWRRPIFWQLTSAYCVPRGRLPGCFSCLIDYHKLRANTLQNILSLYVARAQETVQAQFDATRTILEGGQQREANRRELSSARCNFEDADRRLREITEFVRRLRELDTGARPVTPPPGENASWVRQKIAEVTGGPAYGGRGWLPVIDYGVRVNIEPLKVAQVIHRAADRIS